MKTSIAMLVLLVAAGIGAPAMAITTSALVDGPEETHQAVVHYGDLNLNTDRGAEQLYQRISYAAHKVCTDVVAPSYITLERSYRECRKTAMENAVAKVDRPRLTALYDQHFPENPVASNKTTHGSHSVG